VSGWIKLEKDLREDLRVKRIAGQLIKCGVCNAPALRPAVAVTLVLGALAQLWMHADSFAREDDTLDITRHEIDELTGIQGFAQFLPADWLEILDSERVKLPGFQEHNGTTAKRKDQTAKRVSKHRAAKRNASPLPTTTPCNAPALPDQTKTRPDQTKKEEPTKVATRPRVVVEPPEFLRLKLAYPRRAGSQPWPRALQAINARLREGHSWDEILDGARRYADFCSATGKVGTEHVQQAARFCGPGKEFLQPWSLPATKADTRLTGNLSAAEEFMRRTEPHDDTH
jgi:hypothetical protein